MRIARKFSVLEWCLIVGIFAIAAAILSPPIGGHGEHSRKTLAISNAKQLGIAMIIYSADYDYKPPFISPFEFGDDPLEPYSKNDSLHCILGGHEGQPHPKGTSDFHFQYILNPETLVQGKRVRLVVGPLSKVGNSEKVIALAGRVVDRENQEWQVVSFLDGHVKSFKPDQLTKTLPVAGDLPEFPVAGRFLWQLPDESSIPKYWAVPYEDVERYAMWAKGKK